MSLVTSSLDRRHAARRRRGQSGEGGLIDGVLLQHMTMVLDKHLLQAEVARARRGRRHCEGGRWRAAAKLAASLVLMFVTRSAQTHARDLVETGGCLATQRLLLALAAGCHVGVRGRLVSCDADSSTDRDL